ncbi:MAG: hypothetical protein ACYTGB_08680, partial [Planctomycetota bacterium]
KQIALVAALTVTLSGAALATTWVTVKIKCPLCQAECQVSRVMSYGGYIYDWPTKYQFFFWPLTERKSVYCCLKCRLSCFMWDFEKLPAAKHDAVRKALENAKFDQEYADPAKIPMTQRLALAEKVYRTLGKDDGFWCLFHRVRAYHIEDEAKNLKDAEKKAAAQKEADAARKKALELADKLVADKEKKGRRKEFLLIRGAMHRFLRDERAALADLEAAAKLTYSNDKMPAEEAKATDKYLSGLLADYIRLIKTSGKIPSDDPEEGANKTTEEFEKWLKERRAKKGEAGTEK